MTTFASELTSPYSVDLTNPLANALVNDGVGIFISDDNLTTVINAVDGSSGTATDITNNERGVAYGNFRVGYDYSGRTAQEQADLDADPFQVFRTIEDELVDHGLKVGNSDHFLEIDGIASTSTINLRFHFQTDMPSSADSIIRFLLDARRTAGNDNDSGDAQYLFRNSVGTWVTQGVTVGHYINGVGIAAMSDLDNIQAGDVLELRGVATTATTLALLGRFSPANNFNGTNYMSALGCQFSRIDIEDDNGLHVINLNRTDLSYTDSNVVNPLTITPVGFPAESGYVRDDVTGELIGYALNAASQSISYPLVGAWSGTITYSDDTTAAVSGSGTYVVNGSTPVIITTFDVTDSNGGHLYDHTTDDVDQIIDTEGGNHASIINAPTSGPMPVVEKQVFTQADYATAPQFVDAEKARTEFCEYLITSDQNWTDDLDLRAGNFPNGVKLRGNGGDFTGDFSDTSIPVITCSFGSSWAHDIRDNTLLAENLIYDLPNHSFAYGAQFDGFKGHRVGIKLGDFSGFSPIGSGSPGFNFQLTESIITTGVGNRPVIDSSNTAGQVSLIDTIIDATTTHGNGVVDVAEGEIINTIINNPSGSSVGSMFTGTLESVVTNDTTGTIQLTDIATGFIDALNNDYRINQTYADANLVDAGWNGSDIAGWAYFDDSGGAVATHGYTSVDYAAFRPAFDFPVVTGTGTAYTAQTPPAPYTGTMNIPSKYVQDGTNDTIDPVADAQQAAIRAPIDELEVQAASIAGTYYAGTHAQTDVLTAMRDLLLPWAQANALQAGDANGQGEIVRAWALAAVTSSYAVVQEEFETTFPTGATTIKSWFDRVARFTHNHFIELTPLGMNNHEWWAGFALMQASVVLQAPEYWRAGTAALYKAEQHIALRTDDFLEKEVARGTLALNYHHFALTPLCMMARLSYITKVAQTSVDLNAGGGAALTELETAAGDTQSASGVNTSSSLIWASLYRDQYAESNIDSLLTTLGTDTSLSNVGGNISAYLAGSAGYPDSSRTLLSEVIGYTLTSAQHADFTAPVVLSTDEDFSILILQRSDYDVATNADNYMLENSAGSAYFRFDTNGQRIRLRTDDAVSYLPGSFVSGQIDDLFDGQVHALEIRYTVSDGYLRSYKNGQLLRQRNDMSWSGKTITFDNISVTGLLCGLVIERNGTTLVNLSTDTGDQSRFDDVSANANHATIINPITETGYVDAQAGFGWNSSEIANWAYFTPVTPVTPTSDVTSDIAFTGPQASFAVDITVDSPTTITSDIAFTGPQALFAVDLNIDPPAGVTSDIAFTGPQASFDVDVTVSGVDGVTSDIAFTGSQATFNVDVIVAQPGQVVSDIAFTGPQAQFAADITVTGVDGVVSDIAFTGPQASFAVDVTVAEPGQVVSDIAFTGPQATFNVDITNRAPVISDIAFTGPQATFAIDITNTHPPVISNIAFTGPQALFNIRITNGEVTDVLTDGNTAILGLESRQITIVPPSREVILH